MQFPGLLCLSAVLNAITANSSPEDSCSSQGPRCRQRGPSWLQVKDAVALHASRASEDATLHTASNMGCCNAFTSWPDVDNGITCTDCMALVLTAPYNGRCDKYCESFGHVCVAAAEEKSEDCEMQYTQPCNQAITGTSDMLCKCVLPDAPASCPAPTPKCCSAFTSWPDVDNGITCTDCMALVLTAPYNGRCDKYCESFGHVCVAAAEEKSEDCEVQYTQPCNQAITGTSDMLCKCVLPDAPASCPALPSTTTSTTTVPSTSSTSLIENACCNAFTSWPDVDNGITCTDCMALVLTAPYNGRCDKYCESFGHVCVAAAEEKSEDCEVQYTQPCNQAITGTSDMLCKCVLPDAPASCPVPPPTTAPPTPSPNRRIQVVGRQLLVEGKPLHIKGVAWNPVPKGGSYPRDLDFSGFVEQDAALMQRMGINAVRTYEPITDMKVLDTLWSKGIWVVNSVYNYGGSSAQSAADAVRATKDHPSILMWSIGNEWNYNGLYVGMSFRDCIARIREVSQIVRSLDTAHPISTIYGEVVDKLDEANQLLRDEIDVWGINTYRGISFGNMFDQYEKVSDKPMYLGEYGADAFNALVNREDREAQAKATRELTEEILSESSVLERGACIGGFIFEFADEWWKDGSGSTQVHDTGGIAPGGGPYPDKTFNEEWWGLVTVDREPRLAFDEYAKTDLPAALAQASVLTG
ncbi:Gusb [Symbiodinium natans]|uniref:Gusb protein n=1 Tax=Symbiodinium natans TaxID=878477 RepID=A0A812T2V0_9DINO|nr:Gusb [Symbiodinium natans]